jgi:serine phosphatase RsbU (regulator of sigma subunit)
MLAVCELLSEERGHLDSRAVVDAAAAQVARLTRADLGIIALEGLDGPIVGSYPRPVSDALVRRTLNEHQDAECRRTSMLSPPVEARVADFRAGAARGIVAAAGPIDGSFSLLDEWLVGVVARRLEAQLALVELHRQRLADADLVRDTALAGILQRELMSAATHRVGRLDVAGRIRPARHVAGDLYDVLPMGADAVAVVADVSGKGVPASLLTAAVHAAVTHAVAAEGAHPSAVVASVDRELSRVLDRTNRIVTIAVAATHMATDTIRIASAGHHPVIARVGGVSELVSPGSPPLGIGSFPAPETIIHLAPGDLVLLGSDGIVDQRRAGGDAYGLERLLTTISGLATSPAGEIADAVLEDVAVFAGDAIQDDDQTALVLAVGKELR